MDIAGGGNVKAAESGTVEAHAYGRAGYGNYITILHKNGSRTLYAHLKSVDVANGQWVNKGDVIGVMGNSGNEGQNAGMGVHLHFEYTAADPWKSTFNDKYYSKIVYQQNVRTNNNNYNSDKTIVGIIDKHYDLRGEYYYYDPSSGVPTIGGGGLGSL